MGRVPTGSYSIHPDARSLATEGRNARKLPVIGSAGCRERLHVFTAERRCQCTTSPAGFIQPGVEVNFDRVPPEMPVPKPGSLSQRGTAEYDNSAGVADVTADA